MLYLNGVYDSKGYFWPVRPPTREDLDRITHTIAKRVSRYLQRAGYLYRDTESEYLDLVPQAKWTSFQEWGIQRFTPAEYREFVVGSRYFAFGKNLLP